MYFNSNSLLITTIIKIYDLSLLYICAYAVCAWPLGVRSTCTLEKLKVYATSQEYMYVGIYEYMLNVECEWVYIECAKGFGSRDYQNKLVDYREM